MAVSAACARKGMSHVMSIVVVLHCAISKINLRSDVINDLIFLSSLDLSIRDREYLGHRTLCPLMLILHPTWTFEIPVTSSTSLANGVGVSSIILSYMASKLISHIISCCVKLSIFGDILHDVCYIWMVFYVISRNIMGNHFMSVTFCNTVQC